jgi:HEAT repeat protein
VLPLLNRPEDKRLAIAVIRQIPSPDALELLANFAGEPDIAEDASAAIIDVASQTKSGLPKEARQKALQTVLEKSANDATKKKADEALKKLG